MFNHESSLEQAFLIYRIIGYIGYFLRSAAIRYIRCLLYNGSRASDFLIVGSGVFLRSESDSYFQSESDTRWQIRSESESESDRIRVGVGLSDPTFGTKIVKILQWSHRRETIFILVPSGRKAGSPDFLGWNPVLHDQQTRHVHLRTFSLSFISVDLVDYAPLSGVYCISKKYVTFLA